MARLLVGTSGYVYRDWRGRFYPRGLGTGRWLEHYATVFPTLELNATFYRLATLTAAERWAASTPPGFVFAAKGSRFITHMKRLRDVRLALQRFFAPLEALGERLRVVLWQLPPRFDVDLARLDDFLRQLPPRYRYAVEFREPTWYLDEVADVLDAHGAAFCEHDLLPLPPPRFTGGFRYLRFHGTAGKYRGGYGVRALRPTAVSLRRWAAGGHDAFAFFNNDLGGHAVDDATTLRALIDHPERPAPLLSRQLEGNSGQLGITGAMAPRRSGEDGR